jgi:hypothetical protein
MRVSRWTLRLEGIVLLLFCCVLLALTSTAAAQNPDSLSSYFEGKQVVVKMDMPGTQKGVDIYPGRPQPLDAKSYGDRLKEFGVSLQNGMTTMVTKVKVNKDSVEFQLGGGGYGTAGENTDTSIHFTPADKTDREKDLERQLNSETNPERRRSLQRELDDLRADRARRDAYNRARAEDDAAMRTQQIAIKRQQGGSRFNIRMDARKMGDSLTPQVVMDALAQYVSFAGDVAGAAAGVRPAAAQGLVVRGPDADPNQTQALRKGMTREQVEAVYGKAVETNDRSENGLNVTTCVYKAKDLRVQADYVNDVLVQFLMSSY